MADQCSFAMSVNNPGTEPRVWFSDKFCFNCIIQHTDENNLFLLRKYLKPPFQDNAELQTFFFRLFLPQLFFVLAEIITFTNFQKEICIL